MFWVFIFQIYSLGFGAFEWIVFDQPKSTSSTSTSIIDQRLMRQIELRFVFFVLAGDWRVGASVVQNGAEETIKIRLITFCRCHNRWLLLNSSFSLIDSWHIIVIFDIYM